MESEFITLAAINKEAEWLRNLLLNIKLWPQLMTTISLHCDSETTMSRAFSKIYNDKSKHIALRHEYARQLISNGIIIVVYIKSKNNFTNPLTKGLLRETLPFLLLSNFKGLKGHNIL